jgi:hypothetical protein
MKKAQSEGEFMHNKAHDILELAGWSYLGCDYWNDPISNTKILTHTAIQIQKARNKFDKKNAIPRPILRSDWQGIRKELQRQLKPYGLTVKTKSNFTGWDKLLWIVETV